MTPRDFLEAARVPYTVQPQECGLWRIERVPAPKAELCQAVGMPPVGWSDYTVLSRYTDATLHLDRGEIVMEDSERELRRHMPIWLNARGRVLITGLGLGCVVRGLLANPAIEHVVVIEMDPRIVGMVWPEFEDDQRAMLIQGDALKVELPAWMRFEFAWHDIWCEGNDGLHELHFDLIKRFKSRCRRQGAWMFPRTLRRVGVAKRLLFG